MLRVLCTAAVGLLAFESASAATRSMSIHFVGDWCLESEENGKTTYALPSWTEGGVCKKILSVHEYGFYTEGRGCEAMNSSLKEDRAPSGTAYIAQVKAHCQPDGPPTPGTVQTFEFSRYKGHLTVEAK
jgi:hypothetical protein